MGRGGTGPAARRTRRTVGPRAGTQVEGRGEGFVEPALFGERARRWRRPESRRRGCARAAALGLRPIVEQPGRGGLPDQSPLGRRVHPPIVRRGSRVRVEATSRTGRRSRKHPLEPDAPRPARASESVPSRRPRSAPFAHLRSSDVGGPLASGLSAVSGLRPPVGSVGRGGHRYLAPGPPLCAPS